ncbi:MAG: ferrochelatase, partial [Kiloniellales bacterium]|nr:ferrochelatase [Kiloniellales bacterium]
MKTAVVLFNLGGPDRKEAIQPFLFNLFNDRAIIGLPQPLRWILAKVISRRRAPIAEEIYAHLGGGSPLLRNTERQAEALEKTLNLGEEKREYRVFIAMRYWHPFAAQTVKDVQAWGAEEVVLLPLYPQFSTTTSRSSISNWKLEAAKAGFAVETKAICCYPAGEGFTAAVARLLREALGKINGPVRVLFSAHGLPKKIVDRGDPYQWQVERSAKTVVAKLAADDLDWIVCYQSRVGPLEWIGPSTEDEIVRAGKDGKSVVVVPIAFVSEHSETLVELDIEYKALAEKVAVSRYLRVRTVSDDSEFIGGLKKLCQQALESEKAWSCQGCERICPNEWPQCPREV